MADRWWQPEPVIEEHGRFLVVRDDLVPGGSKMRFLPYLVEGAREVVFGGPFCGGAPFSLSTWGARTGTKVTLFYAKRGELHPRQIACLRNGATVYQVPYGYMSNVQAKARAYAESVGARFLPLGFDLPAAAEPFIEQIRRVRAAAGPIDEVWAATGSGMLARSLGVAFAPIPVVGVRVGLDSRNQAQAFPPNVRLVKAPYDFARPTRTSAPFPCCPNYDRKAWEMAQEQAMGRRVLFWNVLGQH